MSIATAFFTARRVQLLSLVALAAGALLLTQTLTPRAHAQSGEPTQQIVLPGQVSIHTDKTVYRAGERIQVCYQLPGHRFYQIFDRQPGQAARVIKYGSNAAGYRCFWGVVTPPYGTETLRLQYYGPEGVQIATTSFQVVRGR